MKTRRFDFNYKPLQFSVSIAVVDNVPDRQDYNSDTNDYTPDYTLSPLVLQPTVGIIDKDETLTSGAVNQSLTNIAWYEIGTDGTKTAILDTNTDYQVTRSGANAGMLKVMKNAQPKAPIKLQFECDYLDTRLNQTSHFIKTHLVICDNSTQYTPMLVLDAPDHSLYNPLRDDSIYTINASLRLGTKECAVENRKFVWEIKREDGTYSEAGSDTTLDYDVMVSDDGVTCTIDKDLMGSEIVIRCRAKYSGDGNPDGVDLSSASPSKEVTITRRIPSYDYDIANLPTNLTAGLLYISPEANIWDSQGVIPDPETDLMPIWYAATNVSSGSPSYSMVGIGMNPTLSTSKVSTSLGGLYALDVVDCGPLCAMVDATDGAVLTDGDSDDNIILFK